MVINFEAADHSSCELFEHDTDFSLVSSIQADVLKRYNFEIFSQFRKLELLIF